jgi:hypothetical protein
MANVYNRGKYGIGEEWIWSSGSFKLMLVTSSYTYSQTHNVRSDITNEITNTGYTAGGNAIASMVTTEDDTNHQSEYTSANVTFTSLAAGDQPYAAIIYENVGTAATDLLIAYCALTTPPAPDGNNYTINCPTDGWFTITDS